MNENEMQGHRPQVRSGVTYEQGCLELTCCSGRVICRWGPPEDSNEDASVSLAVLNRIAAEHIAAGPAREDEPMVFVSGRGTIPLGDAPAGWRIRPDLADDAPAS
jgi:hypothetical protein